jgi:thymidylate kinase
MKIVIDGNDGTGKSMLAARLQQLGYAVSDRGVPTDMTDDPGVKPIDGEVYLILDAPVLVSRNRLEAAGKNLNERYHTVADLTKYHRRFLEVAASLGDRCVLIDACGTADEVLAHALRAIDIFACSGR